MLLWTTGNVTDKRQKKSYLRQYVEVTASRDFLEHRSDIPQLNSHFLNLSHYQNIFSKNQTSFFPFGLFWGHGIKLKIKTGLAIYSEVQGLKREYESIIRAFGDYAVQIYGLA